MSKPLFLKMALVPLVVGMILATLSTAALAQGQASMETFAGTDDSGNPATFFALSVKPSPELAKPGPRDVVFMIDTSASQTGQYRVKSLAALDAALASLNSNDRVHLMAVDISPVSLTDGFVSPGSAEFTAARQKLDRRVPLGATDLKTAFTKTAEFIEENGSSNPRSVVFIGEGTSRAQLMGTDEFADIKDQLVEARTSVTSMIVGPRADKQILGCLAGQTGGVLIDGNTGNGTAEGVKLAEAAEGTVLWPTRTNIPAELKVGQKETPPLRTDRDTVLVGTTQANGPVTLDMTCDTPDGSKTMVWQTTPAPSSIDNSYLQELVSRVNVDGGLTAPIIGTESMNAARGDINDTIDTLAVEARRAMALGDLNTAQQLVDKALKADPGNTQALAVGGALKRQLEAGGAGGPAIDAGMGGFDPGDLMMVGGGNNFAAEEDTAGAMLSTLIQTEVQNAINSARGQMGTDPDLAIQTLKFNMERVKDAQGLQPDVRDQLIDTIQASLRAASRRKEEIEYDRQRTHEVIAALEERQLLNENLLRTEQKARQLMERFNSLMKEGRYRLAEEQAAGEAARLIPDNPAPVVATLSSRTSGYVRDAQITNVLRQKGVVDTYAQVEKSSIPIPDEPPIVYPDSQVWQELSAKRKEEYSSMDLANRGNAEKKISEALKSPTELECIEIPLTDMVEQLKEHHGIEIQIDNKALNDVGIDPSTPITKSLSGISLRSALRLTLRELELTYVIQDEVLLITTPEEAETQLVTKVYPVADLVLPIRAPSFSGGFGGMGGGGGNQMGYGQSNSGFNNMNNGNINGNQGNQGIFNVPAEFVPQNPVGGFRSFSVRDTAAEEATAQPATIRPAGVSETPAAEPTKPELDNIPLEMLPKTGDAEEAWDNLYTRFSPKPEAVREAVRGLMEKKQYDHVISMINAALRHGEPAPWMYEALTIAMVLDGRPKAEIERAVMSGLDFMENVTDMMNIGMLMNGLGLETRALDIFREVSESSPLWDAPYMLALRTSERIDNIEAKKWASLGILSQAWTSEQSTVWRAGVHAASAILDRLKEENKLDEMREYEAKLNEAVERDCVVQVKWTGNADIDLVVEEPAGTVCSSRNLRTTAGGVLLGDAFSHPGGDDIEGYSEVYVCPKGFSGTYRLLVKRSWGEVTGGKVQIEVIRHYRSKKPIRTVKHIALEDDKAFLTFDLENGRRTDSIDDLQVETALNRNLASQQILAQQLQAAADPQALASLYNTIGNTDGQGTTQPNPLFAFNGKSAVGYQPVIVVLPEGTNFSATAVISADRRYVRITSVPLFSGIAKVDTFSLNGSNNDTTTGTGGQGYTNIFQQNQGAAGVAGNNTGNGTVDNNTNNNNGGINNGIF